jgi:hypothetical protein
MSSRNNGKPRAQSTMQNEQQKLRVFALSEPMPHTTIGILRKAAPGQCYVRGLPARWPDSRAASAVSSAFVHANLSLAEQMDVLESPVCDDRSLMIASLVLPHVQFVLHLSLEFLFERVELLLHRGDIDHHSIHPPDQLLLLLLYLISCSKSSFSPLYMYFLE